MNDRFRLGHAWRLRGRPRLALGCYRGAALENPAYTPAWAAWAELVEAEGDRQGALDIYRQAATHNPHDLGLKGHVERLLPPEPLPENGPTSTGKHVLLYTDIARYGAGEISHALAGTWRRAGYRVTMAQPFSADLRVRQRHEAGVAHRFLAPDNVFDLGGSPRALTDAREARQLLQELRPDLVLFADGIPFSNLTAKEASLELGLRAGVVVHLAQPGWRHDYAPFLERLIRVYARLPVAAVSEDNLQVLIRHFGLPQGRVIRNGRPEIFFRPCDPAARSRLRGLLGLEEDDFLVLTVASLEARKGFPFLLPCLPELTDMHFAWAGSGTLETQLREHTFGQPVHFLGERDDVADWLDACDAVLQPSMFEGMPLSILEAMAKARPVLASAVSGIPEAMGDTGSLLPALSPDPGPAREALITTLRAWRDEPTLRRRLGEAGRRRAQELFREERMCADYLAWTEELIK